MTIYIPSVPRNCAVQNQSNISGDRIHTARNARSTPNITRRQLQSLYWVQAGKSATDIGCILGLSPRTVEAHLAQACKRLGVRTRIQAVLRAKDMGLLADGEPNRPPSAG
ncbi:MAG: helix-turn-helix transcriptional regulator [Caulobacteraceae bacterium]|nr:helix-turn-helix transcriptional regulator [Caulobacteraceae bacterium]